MSATQIQRERKLAKNYELSRMDDSDLVELTQDNVARVEAMIRTDSNYRISLGDNYNSNKYSPYWIKQMGKYLMGELTSHTIEYIVDQVVKCLDNENSTHLNTDGGGRKAMATIIIDYIKQDKLFEYLKNRNFELIERLAEKTIPNPGKHGRKNISFASKFCHYTCFYIFDGEDAQDNFSIYDGVVANALPKYLDYYEINDVDRKKIRDKDYSEYSKAIDAVIEISGFQISRNGFDHLVWYYFKGER